MCLNRKARLQCVFARGMASLALLLAVEACSAQTALPPATAPIESTLASPVPPPLVTEAAPTIPPDLIFDGNLAYQFVQQQVALGPRIAGSAASRALGNQVFTHLSACGWMTSTQDFVYRNTPIRNMIGVKGNGPQVIILGAHYDTRRLADQDAAQPNQPVPGANDGASGVAVLMELARTLKVDPARQQVWLAFFDAEDNGGLDGWEWLVGSRYFASHLTVTPTAVIIADMVGDAQQELYLERNSNPELSQQIWDVAQQLGYGAQFQPVPKWSMLDDHTPFLERGWRAIDIIDFDYPYWHTTQDTSDKVSPLSLERVGRTIEAWVESR